GFRRNYFGTTVRYGASRPWPLPRRVGTVAGNRSPLQIAGHLRVGASGSCRYHRALPNDGAAMSQPTPDPASRPDQSRLAGLPPAGMQAMRMALQAVRRGDANEVLRLTGEVLDLVPGHPEALRLAGIAHAAGGRHDLARDALQRSLDARPGDPLVLI